MPKQQKWATKLLGYNFEIIYRPGRHNQAADFLSSPPSSFFLAESSPIPNILTELYHYYALEEGTKEVQNLM